MIFRRIWSSLISRWRTCVLIAVIGLAVLMMVPWLCGGWITAKVQATMRDRLAERGLKAEWREVSWSLWRGGATFRNFSLRENEGDQRPLVEADSLSVGIPPWEWIGSRDSRVTSWSVNHTRVVLTDGEGSIALEDVSAEVKSRRGKIVVQEARARRGGLEVDLEGSILTRKEPLRPLKPFVMNLRAVRGTLAVLDFEKDKGRFKVKGNFEVDLRNGAPFEWSAKLHGAGGQVVLKGVPLAKARAEAELTSADSKINAEVSTEHGDASAVIRRIGGWKTTPFTFEGSIADRTKGRDEFQGRYEDLTLVVGELKGNADLWQIAGDIPMLAEGRSAALEFRQFPAIEAKDIRWRKDDGWSMERARIRNNGAAVVKREGREIDLRNLSGSAGYSGKRWQLDGLGADLLGGSVVVSGSYRDGQLSKGKVKAEALKISEIKRALGKKKASGPDGSLFVSYEGAAHFKNLDFDGSGSARLDDAPVIEVPLLDEVHDLFSSLIPGVERSSEGKFNADFSATEHVIHVKRFEASGGTLVVNAEGDVDLKKETVQGSARGRLTGLPGVVTSPLSRLLEMEVGGTLEHIKVQRLRPGKVISNAATGVIDVVEDAIKGTGEAGKSLKR